LSSLVQWVTMGDAPLTTTKLIYVEQVKYNGIGTIRGYSGAYYATQLQPGHPSVGRRNEYWRWSRDTAREETASSA